MTPDAAAIVKPDPYFEIEFRCSCRAFYEVKHDMYIIADRIGIEIEDGYISTKRDYEGDLEKIIIYGDERSQEFRQAVMEYYSITNSIPKDMEIHLTNY